jgi:hypothetical protein
MGQQLPLGRVRVSLPALEGPVGTHLPHAVVLQAPERPLRMIGLPRPAGLNSSRR